MTAPADHFEVIRDTAARVLKTVIFLHIAEYRGAPEAERLHADLYAELRVLADAIDALPPEVISARPSLHLAELSRLPGLLARPDIQPSAPVLRRTLEAPMRDILRVIPKRARVIV